MLHEQKVYAKLEFGAERKMLNRFVLIRDESDKGEYMWVAKVLLLSR